MNPLTGLCDGISDQALTRRPIAVMVNNIIASLPQWGISQADIIYEMLAEGRITRFLALFQDYSKIDKLASIRSARPYYMDMPKATARYTSTSAAAFPPTRPSPAART